jgi:hypothetical protein
MCGRYSIIDDPLVQDLLETLSILYALNPASTYSLCQWQAVHLCRAFT